MKMGRIHHILGLGSVTVLLAGWPLLAQAPLPVNGGGTGQPSFTQGFILFGAGTNPLLSDPNLFWDNTNKRLGIGTTSPAFALEVIGSIIIPNATAQYLVRRSNGVAVGFASLSSNDDMFLGSTNMRDLFLYAGTGALRLNTGAAANALVVANGGNVGFGTAVPGALVTLSADKAPVLRLNSATSALNVDWPAIDPLGKIEWYTNDLSTNGTGVGASIQAIPENAFTSPYTATGLAFSTRPNATAVAEVMRISGTGNVGIGTATPANKLHVAGSITVDGNINAKYQDVAEWVPSSGVVRAGTVVVIDGTRSNAILPSTAAYDTRIAGVVTDAPGLLLGEAGEDKAKVATTGRVRVRATATNGAIRMGDLLVTSDLQGLAMKSVPAKLAGFEMHRPGTLIGKALEPLSEGEGEILVLLSLQ